MREAREWKPQFSEHTTREPLGKAPIHLDRRSRGIQVNTDTLRCDLALAVTFFLRGGGTDQGPPLGAGTVPGDRDGCGSENKFALHRSVHPQKFIPESVNTTPPDTHGNTLKWTHTYTHIHTHTHTHTHRGGFPVCVCVCVYVG